MNVRDSEVICGLLVNAGYRLTNDSHKADVIIFNTCSVRKHAEDRVFSLIGEYKKSAGLPLLGIVGCMAKHYKEEIFNKSACIDFVVGPADIDKVPKIIKSLLINKSYLKKKVLETSNIIRPQVIYHTGFYENKKHAYVVISEGCSNFCSYCIVPYVRGPLCQRNHKDILKEIRLALRNGIVSFTFLGQNVNSYSDGSVNFIRLLELANSLKGLKELDFMTSHPKDASTGLFKAIAGLEKIKKSLHLPVQSGSDRILKLMNRGYSVNNYLDLVDNYRKIVKGGRISTDIIVGFPTESEADFNSTLTLCRKVQFDSAFIFKYSPRPNTKASKMQDDVTKDEKERRHRLMLNLQKSIIGAACFLFLILSQAYALNIDQVKINFLSGNYKLAINEAKRIISEDGYSSELYYFLGLSYLKEGEYQMAADSFRFVINNFKDPKFKEESRIGLADTYLLRGDFNNASSIYRDLLSENPRTKFKDQIDQRLSGKAGLVMPYVTAEPYSVQVGSFTSVNNAKNLTQKLINSGYLAYIEESNLSTDKSYKVRVGRLKTLKEAEVLQRRLTSQGYPTKIYP